MNLRFSRSSLNLIIFACIILIGWASIDKNRIPEAIDAHIIDLPALSELRQQTWTSREGVQVIWQSRLDTDFNLRVRGQIPNATQINNADPTSISWQKDYWQWDINIGKDFEQGLSKLSQQIKDFPLSLKERPATIVLQGPWSAEIARLTSARLIKSLKLKSLDNRPLADTYPTHSPVNSCPWQPVSAQFWLQDQLSNANQSRADITKKQWIISSWPELPTIDEPSLITWKQTFVQQWQLNWQNPVTQFDILSDLAYYRLPENYLLQGYWGINALDVKQLENYLAQCSMPEQSQHASQQ